MDQVSLSFAAQPVLRDFTLHVDAGEFVALVGASGAGKTTIFRLLTGMLQPDLGRIQVLGAPPAPGRVGYMPQRDCLMPWRTALDNAAAVLREVGLC